jgi:hypothetical protein
VKVGRPERLAKDSGRPGGIMQGHAIPILEVVQEPGPPAEPRAKKTPQTDSFSPPAGPKTTLPYCSLRGEFVGSQRPVGNWLKLSDRRIIGEG